LPPSDLFPLDHDQRNTLNLGGDITLPWRSFASTNVYYGSGFSNAFPGHPYPGDHLPQHTTFDLSVGKDFGERFSASLNALNVANRRVNLDNSQTFGGLLEKPTFLEAFLVRRARRWAIPAKAKHLKNPIPANAEMLEHG
jgi:outer membrane receptor protein involved in Fe transport